MTTPVHIQIHMQIVQELKQDSKPYWWDFTSDMPHWQDMGPGFLPGVYAYDALFYQSEKVRTVYACGTPEVLTATKNRPDAALEAAFGVE